MLRVMNPRGVACLWCRADVQTKSSVPAHAPELTSGFTIKALIVVNGLQDHKERGDSRWFSACLPCGSTASSPRQPRVRQPSWRRRRAPLLQVMQRGIGTQPLLLPHPTFKSFSPRHGDHAAAPEITHAPGDKVQELKLQLAAIPTKQDMEGYIRRLKSTYKTEIQTLTTNLSQLSDQVQRLEGNIIYVSKHQ